MGFIGGFCAANIRAVITAGIPALILYFDTEVLEEKMKDAANIVARLCDPRTKPFLLFLKNALSMFKDQYRVPIGETNCL